MHSQKVRIHNRSSNHVGLEFCEEARLSGTTGSMRLPEVESVAT